MTISFVSRSFGLGFSPMVGVATEMSSSMDSLVGVALKPAANFANGFAMGGTKNT